MFKKALSKALQFDAEHIWHPYTSLINPAPVLPVESASGVHLKLATGEELIDGMSSWWCAIHGYNHPALNQALISQIGKMPHVMFGGLTHEPAIQLAQQLIDITSPGLTRVFFADSGSVSVEVAMKMAVQYWVTLGKPQKHRFMTVRGGYHGDTQSPMSVCDPQGGMHHLFKGFLTPQIFAPVPECQNDNVFTEQSIAGFKTLIEKHQHECAAVILEPIVQGAGGMRFYCPEYLRQVRALCNEYGVLLILDEIATGFGRTGKLFAYEYAGIEADILTVGKALTGGTMTLAATLTTDKIAEVISDDGNGAMMHGPTFMANPLACAVANASIDVLLNSDWQANIARIEAQFIKELEPCQQLSLVKDVRVLGAIAVIELHQEVDTRWTQPRFTERGVWLRPFRNLVYSMPPYIISNEELSQLTSAMCDVVTELDEAGLA